MVASSQAADAPLPGEHPVARRDAKHLAGRTSARACARPRRSIVLGCPLVSGVAAARAEERLLAGVATSAEDTVSFRAVAWAGGPALNGAAAPAPAPSPFWTPAPTEPFPVTAGPDHWANGRQEPGSGLHQPGYGYHWSTGHRREPRNSHGTLGSSERKTIGMPPWGPVQDPEPGEQSTYSDAFTPLPREVDRP